MNETINNSTCDVTDETINNSTCDVTDETINDSTCDITDETISDSTCDITDEEIESQIDNISEPEIDNAERLKEIQSRLSNIIKTDKANWSKVFTLMYEVNENQLYKEAGCRSFTMWINNISLTLKVHVSLLWERYRAGKVYKDYYDRQVKNGESVPNINETKIPATSLVLIDKIAGNNNHIRSDLIHKAEQGKLSRKVLKQAWNIRRSEKEAKGFSNKKNGYDKRVDAEEDDNENTTVHAHDIVFALQNDRTWCGTRPETVSNAASYFSNDKYLLLSEFPVVTGSSAHARRIDAMVIENLSVEPSRLALHGIEIKVNMYDLKNDTKMAEYYNFCDKFYIAIPKDLIKFAEEYASPEWGILVFDKDDESIKVHKEAIHHFGEYRDIALETALIKIHN